MSVPRKGLASDFNLSASAETKRFTLVSCENSLKTQFRLFMEQSALRTKNDRSNFAKKKSKKTRKKNEKRRALSLTEQNKCGRGEKTTPYIYIYLERPEAREVRRAPELDRPITGAGCHAAVHGAELHLRRKGEGGGDVVMLPHANIPGCAPLPLMSYA